MRRAPNAEVRTIGMPWHPSQEPPRELYRRLTRHQRRCLRILADWDLMPVRNAPRSLSTLARWGLVYSFEGVNGVQYSLTDRGREALPPKPRASHAQI